MAGKCKIRRKNNCKIQKIAEKFKKWGYNVRKNGSKIQAWKFKKKNVQNYR